MALTYPAPMPNTGVAECEFDLVIIDQVNERTGASGPTTELAPSYWEVSMATTNVEIGSARHRAWIGFLDRLRGRQKVALLYDPSKPYPAAYTSFSGLTKAVGGAAFVGLGNLKTITGIRELIIEGLPAAFVLKETDYVGFVRSGRYSLHRIMQDATANGSGEATIFIEGELPLMYTVGVGSVANFLRPYGEFMLDGRYQAPRGLEAKPISFRAKSRAF